MGGEWLEAYLRRIDYHGPLEPCEDTLRGLHHAHLLAVPFENLDVARHVPIALDRERILEKIVARERGGFCYELNTAFAWLLERLGFRLDLLAANVFSERGCGPDFDHMAVAVHLEDLLLADVGFGESFLYPLRIHTSTAQWDGGVAFRVDHDAYSYTLFRGVPGEHWDPKYRFTLKARRLEEFAGMCEYHQSSPESAFTQRRLVTRATPAGRLTLTERRFIETRDGERCERDLEGEREFQRLLRKHFAIDLGD